MEHTQTMHNLGICAIYRFRIWILCCAQPAGMLHLTRPSIILIALLRQFAEYGGSLWIRLHCEDRHFEQTLRMCKQIYESSSRTG